MYSSAGLKHSTQGSTIFTTVIGGNSVHIQKTGRIKLNLNNFSLKILFNFFIFFNFVVSFIDKLSKS